MIGRTSIRLCAPWVVERWGEVTSLNGHKLVFYAGTHPLEYGARCLRCGQSIIGSGVLDSFRREPC